MRKNEENKNSNYTYQESEIFPYYDEHIESLTPRNNSHSSRNGKIVNFFYFKIYRNQSIF